MGIMSEENRIDANTVETVCTECYHITPPGRVVASCPLCGGRTIRVPRGTAQEAVKELKQRGESHFSII